MKKHRHLLCSLLSLLLVFSIVASTNVTALAAGPSEVFLARGVCDYGESYNYEVRAYLKYNSNTATSLDIYSQIVWVFNNGATAHSPQNVMFTAHDGAMTKTVRHLEMLPTIENGGHARIEADWADACVNARPSYDTPVFSKNSDYKYAYTNAAVYYDEAFGAGVECFWYADRYEASFHY